jgi:hypothetical protein
VATQAPGGLDFETLRRAIEERDAETLDLRDGKIVRQVNVEAWDE